jgi:hypothetical protein
LFRPTEANREFFGDTALPLLVDKFRGYDDVDVRTALLRTLANSCIDQGIASHKAVRFRWSFAKRNMLLHRFSCCADENRDRLFELGFAEDVAEHLRRLEACARDTVDAAHVRVAAGAVLNISVDHERLQTALAASGCMDALAALACRPPPEVRAMAMRAIGAVGPRVPPRGLVEAVVRAALDVDEDEDVRAAAFDLANEMLASSGACG